MKNFVYLAVIIFIGCQSPSDKIMEDFKEIDRSLDKSSESIENANRQLAVVLQNDSGAAAIKNEATFVLYYIETVKGNIKYISGKTDSDEGMDNLTASNKVMFEQKKADTVFDALKKFHNLALLNCEQDSIKERINIRFQYLNDTKKQGEVFFRDVPAVAALTMLSKFENDVKYTENLILSNSLLKRN